MRIDAIWIEISQSKELPAFRRISESHPLDIYIGLDEESKPLLLLVSRQLAPNIGSFQSLSVHRLRREDGLWSYTISLEVLSLKPLFALLCEDLVASTETLEAEAGTLVFFARLKRWKALLATGASGLTEQEVRGLLAELYALSEILAPAFGIVPSVLGWAGPEAEEQDFRVSGRAFEVKSIGVGKTRVQIASLRQLDFLSGPLDLLVIPMSPAAPDRGTSLSALAALIRNSLNADHEALVAFESKLMITGYVTGDPAVERHYSISAASRYEVGGSFPCLVPSSVPVGIVETSYTIDLSLCQDFERALPL